MRLAQITLARTALVASALSLTLTGCSEVESQVEHTVVRPVKLIEVDGLTHSIKRSFPARIEANKQAELAFRLSGELITLPLLEGQEVKQGDVLAELDNRDAKNNLLLREADFELADADYRRKAELLKKTLISKAEFDTAKATLKSAKANLASAKDQLSYTQLVAPFSGVVAKRIIDNFQTVQAGQAILTLQRNDVVDVTIQVPESVVLEVDSKGKTVADYNPRVTFSTYPDYVYPVTFKEFSTQVSPGTQSYKAAFLLSQPKEFQVLPGMSAELSLDFSSTSSSLGSVVLPASAISVSDASGESRIWLFDDQTGTVKPSNVTLGEVRTHGIEVLSGIDQGDKVVAAGVQHLHDGMQVKPLKWERGV